MNAMNKVLLTNKSAPAITQAIQIVRNNSTRELPSYSLFGTRHPHQFVFFVVLILMTVMTFFVGTKNAMGNTTPVVTTSVKWHPGHYYAILSYGKNSSRYLSQVYQELKKTPSLRGIQIRYRWAELEQAEGEYDFSSIAQRLSELSALRKRLVIVIDTKTSLDSGEEIVPDYLKTSTYDGGDFDIDSQGKKGKNITLWNSAVRDRLIALIRELGQRFNSHHYFEGIGISDSSLGEAVIPLTLAQKEDYYSNLLNVQQQMCNFFPNTLTFQFISYPRSILSSFIGNLNEMGAGLGAPEISPDMPSLVAPYPPTINGYFRKYSDVIPLVVTVKYANYVNTRSDHMGHEPTVSELLSFARDYLNSNYIFWTRHPDYSPKVLELLKFKAQESTPSGGLNSRCPSVYSSCVN